MQMWRQRIPQSSCKMSYSRPEYTLVPFSSNTSYKAWIYNHKFSDRPLTTIESFSDTEKVAVFLIFFPGSSGSYRQVRSIASNVLKRSLPSDKLAWITLDFAKDASAISSSVLLSQTQYTKSILSKLHNLNPMARFVFIGHSIGGVIAASIVSSRDVHFTCQNSNGIVAIGVPISPVIIFDWEMQKFYKSAFDCGNCISSIPMVSISGGERDHMVSSRHSQSVCVNHAFIISSKTKDINCAVDHKALVWCEQLVDYTANTVLGMARGESVEYEKMYPHDDVSALDLMYWAVVAAFIGGMGLPIQWIYPMVLCALLTFGYLYPSTCLISSTIIHLLNEIDTSKRKPSFHTVIPVCLTFTAALLFGYHYAIFIPLAFLSHQLIFHNHPSLTLCTISILVSSQALHTSPFQLILSYASLLSPFTVPSVQSPIVPILFTFTAIFLSSVYSLDFLFLLTQFPSVTLLLQISSYLKSFPSK